MTESRTLDQQLDQMERLALSHYPEDESARQAYLLGLLKQRLREYAAMVGTRGAEVRG